MWNELWALWREPCACLLVLLLPHLKLGNTGCWTRRPYAVQHKTALRESGWAFLWNAHRKAEPGGLPGRGRVLLAASPTLPTAHWQLAELRGDYTGQSNHQSISRGSMAFWPWTHFSSTFISLLKAWPTFIFTEAMPRLPSIKGLGQKAISKRRFLEAYAFPTSQKFLLLLHTEHWLCLSLDQFK